MCNNPKRPAYHETGHLVALFLLTGGLDNLRRKEEPVYFNTVKGHQRIFHEVCFYVAGGVAERVYCNLSGFPRSTTVEDLDLLYTLAKYDWDLPFRQSRKGYQVCPTLENLIKTAIDFVTSLFRSRETILKVWAVADCLIENNCVSDQSVQDIIFGRSKARKVKKQILNILK